MKINVIGMILNNAGRRSFDSAVLDDCGKPMSAADSLHAMIMEYAKVFNGGTSDLVTLSREVLVKPPAPAQAAQSTGASASIDIDYRQAADLLKMFAGEPTIVTLSTGDGYGGKGLYAHYYEVPEEGAEYLGVAREEAAPDVEDAAKVLAECMDYPWGPMPKNGKDLMRAHVVKIMAAAHTAPQPESPAQVQDASSAFTKALEIRSAQGWKLTGEAIPVLYTDTINDQQVMRDDVWLCTTAALKSAQAAADARDAILFESSRWGGADCRLAVWESLRILGSRMGVTVTKEDQYTALATHQQGGK